MMNDYNIGTFQKNVLGFTCGFGVPIVLSTQLRKQNSTLSQSGVLSGLFTLSFFDCIPLSVKIGGIVAGSFLMAEMALAQNLQLKGRCSEEAHAVDQSKALKAAVIGSVFGVTAKFFEDTSFALAFGMITSGTTAMFLFSKQHKVIWTSQQE